MSDLVCQDSGDVLIVRKSFPLDCIIHNAAVLSLYSTAALKPCFSFPPLKNQHSPRQSYKSPSPPKTSYTSHQLIEFYSVYLWMAVWSPGRKIHYVF